jgi:hypothetical protein
MRWVRGLEAIVRTLIISIDAGGGNVKGGRGDIPAQPSQKFHFPKKILYNDKDRCFKSGELIVESLETAL